MMEYMSGGELYKRLSSRKRYSEVGRANADGRFPMDKNGGGNGKIIRKPPKQMEVSSLNGIIVWLAMFENTGVCCITMKWQFLMISQWMQGGLPSFSPSICRQTHIWGFP